MNATTFTTRLRNPGPTEREQLLHDCAFTYDEQIHEEPWRNALAAQLNRTTQLCRDALNAGLDKANIRAALELVKKQANEEGIRLLC